MPQPSDSTTPRNLYQKIADVCAALEPIDATGKNQFRATAMSISDVENALRKPLAEAGIITRWSYVKLETTFIGDVGPGREKLWQANLKVTVVNSSDPEDSFTDEWCDIGGNPMAAVSFARKGYLKALFHLTEEADETGVTPTRPQPRPPYTPPQASTARPVTPPPTPTQPTAVRPEPPAQTASSATTFMKGSPCPFCAEEGNSTTTGTIPTFWIANRGPNAGQYQCNGLRSDGGFANHLPPVMDAEVINDPSDVPF